MPRSVKSVVGRDKASGLNPMNLVQKAVAMLAVFAMVLLGTATLAGATTTTITNVTASTTHPRASETGTTWAIGFTSSATLVATDSITVTMPTGTTFVSPTAAFTTGATCPTPTVTFSANVATVSLSSCTAFPQTGAPVIFNLTGVTNTSTVGSTTSTVNITGNSTAVASSPAQLIYAAAIAAPTVTNTGNGQVSVAYTTNGSPVSVTGSYVVSDGANGTITAVGNCPTYPNSDTSGVTTTQTCTVTGLTAGTTYTFTVTPTNGTDPAAAVSTSLAANSALATPTATRAGSGDINVAFTADGVANHYVVTSTPGGFTCTVAAAGAVTPAAQNCTVAGLTNGTSYTFTVTPSGNGTTSTVSPASNAVIPGAALAKPTVALAGTGTVMVSFVADGVATTYTVTTASGTPSTGTCVVANTTTPPTGAQSCNVSGLTNNNPYTFIVTPTGNNTSSSASPASASITASTQLNAPTVAVAGNDSVKVSFVADGVASTYTVMNASGGTVGANTCIYSNTTTAPTGVQNCTVTGLATGVVYTFTVSPTGNATTSTTSNASAPVTATTALATPTVANAGAGSVAVSFVADGYATTYTVAVATGTVPSTSTGSCVVANTATPPTGAQSCTVTGLSNATAYTFKVTPTGGTAATPSTVSASSASITTVSQLATPTVTSGGNGAATVHFTADGTATTYVVAANPGNFTCTVTGTTAPAANSAQTCTVTGLATGTAYTFTVTPSGGGDTTVASLASASFTVGSAIATPTVTNAGSEAITVTFQADGVASTYVVSNASGGVVGANTCTIANTTTAPKGTQNCTVTGLNNALTYTFIVTPSGNNTPSAASAASVSIQPSSALAAPTVSNAGSGAIKVSFVADGAATTYTVSTASGAVPSGSTGTCVVANTTTPPTGAQSCTVTGLTNGVTYSFIVTPSGGTAALPSTPSAASSTIMAGVNFLAAPTVSYGASGAALVTFTADGVASTYTVNTASGTLAAGVSGSCTFANSTTAPQGTQSCTVTGLTNGSAYTFTVTPSGNGTTSLQSAPSAAYTAVAAIAPSVAQTVTATGAQNSIVVTWKAPASNGGSPITGYAVSAVSGNSTTTCGTVAATATTCTISGLAAGTYAVTVSAMNAAGTGVASAASSATVTAPIPPVRVQNLFAGHFVGQAIIGRSVISGIQGGGFYGQPRVTSNNSGTTVRVSHDDGVLLTVIVTTNAHGRTGWHTLTITLANGMSCKVNYLTVK